MRTRKMLAILVLALGLIVCQARVSEAAPMGTAFTYEGHLYDANYVAYGPYDFQFKLFDDPCTGIQVGGDVNKPDVDVIEAYFKVELDFGDVFDGEARWLEIGVRPGDMNDPNEYTVLEPRQKVTPTPYALYAKTAGTGGGSLWQVSGSNIYYNNGNVSIGTTNPLARMHIEVSNISLPSEAIHHDDIIVEDTDAYLGLYSNDEGTVGSAVILAEVNDTSGSLVDKWSLVRETTEGSGNGALHFTYGTSKRPWDNSTKMYIDTSGNVGIGTTSPRTSLDTLGRISTGSPSNAWPGAVTFFPPDGHAWFHIDNGPAGGRPTGRLRISHGNDPGDYELISILQNGNVGIGTTSPSATLDVNGAILRTGSTMYGADTNTHINLGVNSITGASGQEYSYPTVGGGIWNKASGSSATVGGGSHNTASGSNGTVGGGIWNNATEYCATVGGGIGNDATEYCATVGGGEENTASSRYATVGGGYNNTASDRSATVGGGEENTASSRYATVGGGYKNTASNWHATVPGGYKNTASGSCSFAAGANAKAVHDGTFVWADSLGGDFASGGAHRFLVRASGGTRIYSNRDASIGVKLSSGSAGWETISDVALKRNIRPVDGKDILSKLAEIPISRWSYKTQNPNIEHIGPMAQDFYGAFGLGEDDKHISTIDPDGVALAAIQGLYGLVQEKDTEIAQLKTRLTALEALVTKLEQRQEGGQK